MQKSLNSLYIGMCAGLAALSGVMLHHYRHNPPTAPVIPRMTSTRAPVTAEAYGRLPLSFERNQGQVDKQVTFLSHGPGYNLFLTADQAVIALQHPQNFASLVISTVVGGQTAFLQTKPSKKLPAKPSVQPIGLKEGLETVLAAWHSPAAGDDYPMKGLVDTFGPATKHISNSAFDYPQDTDLNPWETIRNWWYFQNANYYVVLVSTQAHNTYNNQRNPPQYIVRIYPLKGVREYDFTVKDFQAGVRATITERDVQYPGPKLIAGDGSPWQKYLIYGKGIGAISELGADTFDGSYEVGTVAEVDSTVWNNRDRDGIICCSITSPAWKLGSKKVLNSKEGKYDDVPDSSLWDYATTDKFLDQAKVSSITICYPAFIVDFQSVVKPTDLTTLKTNTCPWTDADILAAIRKSWKMGFNRDCDVTNVLNILHGVYDSNTHSFPITVDVQWSGLFTKNQIDRVSSSIKLIDGAWQLDNAYQLK